MERAQGELTRPVIVEPPVALQWSERASVSQRSREKTWSCKLKTNIPGAAGTVHGAGAVRMADCAGVRSLNFGWTCRR